jgi:hypothetical protein
MTGLHLVRDVMLKAPDDVIEVALKHRNARRGEIDICVNFKFAGEPTPAVIEAVRSTASAVMSLLNLEFKDFLVPSAPFQVRQVLPEGRGQMDTMLSLQVEQRETIGEDQLQRSLRRIAQTLGASPYGAKLTVALELYAANLAEKHVRVRFLLLVVAMEALAKSAEKDQAATELLDRWRSELAAKKLQYPPDSEAWLSLDALGKELSFRREDSIRSQVRKLFVSLPNADPNELKTLQRRALHVYDRRSVLVHEGHIPGVELKELEAEARVLLEVLLSAAIAEQESSESGGSAA